MPEDRTSSSNTSAIKLVLMAAYLSVIVGIMVLIGWAADVAVLKSILSGWVSVKANAAVCFTLTGFALLLITRPLIHNGLSSCPVSLSPSLPRRRNE